MLKIGDFSKLSRISIRMLRHYDEIGLLKPMKIDPVSGYRYYGEKQLALACRIHALKEMGFGLAEICEMKDIHSAEALEERLLEKSTELMHLMKQTAGRLRLLDTAVNRLRKGETMNYDVMIKTIPERTAACLRMTIPTYEQEGMVWGVLNAETEPLKIVPDDPCLCSVVFHDAEFKEKDVDVEAQKTVKGEYPDTEHVRFCRLPEVQAAACIHRGAYTDIGEAYSALLDWIHSNGYACCGDMFNIYHVSPHETQNEAEFVTEVCMPVEKQ